MTDILLYGWQEEYNHEQLVFSKMKPYLHCQPDWTDARSCREINNQQVLRLFKEPSNLQSRIARITQKAKCRLESAETKSHWRQCNMEIFSENNQENIQRYLKAVTYVGGLYAPQQLLQGWDKGVPASLTLPQHNLSIFSCTLFSLILCHIPLFHHFSSFLYYSHSLHKGMSRRIQHFSSSGQSPLVLQEDFLRGTWAWSPNGLYFLNIILLMYISLKYIHLQKNLSLIRFFSLRFHNHLLFTNYKTPRREE